MERLWGDFGFATANRRILLFPTAGRGGEAEMEPHPSSILGRNRPPGTKLGRMEGGERMVSEF